MAHLLSIPKLIRKSEEEKKMSQRDPIQSQHLGANLGAGESKASLLKEELSRTNSMEETLNPHNRMDTKECSPSP